MGQGGVPVERIVDTLGEGAIQVVAAPRGLGVRVSGPRLYDPDDPHAIAPGELVFGVNVADSAALLEDAEAAGATAIAVRDRGSAWDSTTVAVLSLSPELTWDQLFSVVHTLSLTPSDDDPDAPVRDLYSLANAIAALVEGAVTIEDPSSTLLAYSTLDQPIDEARRQTILGRGHGHAWAERLREVGAFRPLVANPGTVLRLVDPLGEARTRLAASVGAGGELLGFVWAVEGDHPFADRELEALRSTLPLAALHLLRHRNAHDVDRRERGLLLRQALLGEQPPEVLGLEGTYAVAAFRIDAREDADLSISRTKAVDLITLAAEAFRRRVVCAWVDNTVYALFPAVDSRSIERLMALCRSIVKQAHTTLGVPVTVGVGGVHTPASLSVARDEADRTARVAASRRLAAAHVDDVRIPVAILAATDLLHERSEIRLPVIDDLLDLDRRTGSEWLPTLQAIAFSGGNVTTAAQWLGLHNNTVRYRLGRITELTGLDLAEPDTLFAVALHLRAATACGEIVAEHHASAHGATAAVR